MNVSRRHTLDDAPGERPPAQSGVAVGDPVGGYPAEPAGRETLEAFREHPHPHEEQTKSPKESAKGFNHFLPSEKGGANR